MKRIPPIKSVMTPFPYSVAIDEPLARAVELLERHGIRHLPVLREGTPCGVIGDRDIQRMLSPRSDGLGSDGLTVREAYDPQAYVVGMNEPLDNVVLHMASHHIGSALIVRNGNLAGVFTASDACRHLAEFLRRHYLPPDGNDAA